MKKVVLASLLAVVCAGYPAHYGFAQPATTGQAAGGQAVEMSPEEGAAYNNARTQTTPAAQAAAWEGYLKAYPQSAVKSTALQALLIAYSAGQDNAARSYAARPREPSSSRKTAFANSEIASSVAPGASRCGE